MNRFPSPWLLVPTIFVLLLSSCSEDLPTDPPPVIGDLPAATLFQADNHPELWGTVTLAWREPGPNEHDLPVVEFHVAVLPGAKTMPDLWSVATVLAVIPADPSGEYAVTLDDRDGVVPGDTADFVVRPKFEGDHWGVMTDAIELTPSSPHTRFGLVRDDLGRPLEGVTVRLLGFDDFADPRGFVTERVTDESGRFESLGPVHESMEMVLVTDSPDVPSAPGAEDAWFDFKTPPLVFEGTDAETEIVLVTRYSFDPGADGIHDWSNIELIQHLAFCRNNRFDNELNHTFRTWESYPLKVYIPDGSSLDGAVDYAEEIRAALEYWNTTLDQVLFMETLDQEEAQISCHYEEYPPSNVFSGAMRFVPQASGETWGITVPVKAALFINHRVMVVPEYTQRTARHEIVHALGWYDHTWDRFGLMYITAADLTPLDYEVRIMKTLLGLPNLQQLNLYEDSYPDYPTY